MYIVFQSDLSCPIIALALMSFDQFKNAGDRLLLIAMGWIEKLSSDWPNLGADGV